MDKNKIKLIKLQARENARATLHPNKRQLNSSRSRAGRRGHQTCMLLTRSNIVDPTNVL